MPRVARGSLVTAIACMAGAILLTVAGLTASIGTVADGRTIAVEFLVVVLGIAGTLIALTLLLRQAKRSATDDWIQMFVDDMRSPLTVILGRLDLLRMDAPDGTAVSEHVDAARMEVSTAGPSLCECDPDIVRRVLENLVSNAIKHTPLGGRIRVNVSAESACVRIAIREGRVWPSVSSPSRRTVARSAWKAGHLAVASFWLSFPPKRRHKRGEFGRPAAVQSHSVA